MKIYIVTGETSGDKHASNVVRELNKISKNQFRAWGGKNLESQNVVIDANIEQKNYMGFWEVFKNGYQVLKDLERCKKNISDFTPDLVLLVDYPGFNLEIAKYTKENNIKTLYYISPKIWAWKSNRIKKIKKYLDEMFVIFPFEQEYYKKRDVNVKYFGNPIFENIKEHNFKKIFRDKPIISLLPGSRKQEIDKNLPTMLKVVNEYPDYNFIVSASNNFTLDYYSKIIKNYNVEIIFDRQYDILKSSVASIITSGTSTLEAALLKIPQIVCYKTSFLSYLVARLFVKVKYISLVNLLLKKRSVVELIQNDFNSDNLKYNLDMLLKDAVRKKIISDYDILYDLLHTKKNVSTMIAKRILDIKNT